MDMAVLQQRFTYKNRMWHLSTPGLLHKKDKRFDETAEARGSNDITQEWSQSKEKIAKNWMQEIPDM